MNTQGVSFFEKTAFGYSQSFQDKKTIIALKKEIESLKTEIEIDKIILDLQKSNVIKIIDNKIIYKKN